MLDALVRVSDETLLLIQDVRSGCPLPSHPAIYQDLGVDASYNSGHREVRESRLDLS